jgi:hypothetical protein
MPKGGFLIELLASRKSTNSFEFVGNLIKYTFLVVLVAIYWGVMTVVFSFIFGIAFRGIQGITQNFVIAATVALVLYFVYLLTFGLTVNNLLLGPVHYMLD